MTIEQVGVCEAPCIQMGCMRRQTLSDGREPDFMERWR